MCKNLFVIIGQRTGLGFERSGYIQHRCFALIRYVIVPENSNQSSRPSGSLLVFASSSHWQTGIFPLFCLVGVYSWFWFWRYSIEMRFTQLTSV